MKNELKIFEGHVVELFELNGQMLFNPYHVANCLEITDINSSIGNFNEKQVVKVKNSDLHNLHIRKLNNAGEKFLTESGVYKLVFKSHKPNAETFTDWLADEVLPSLRTMGNYNIYQEKQVAFKEQVECVGLVADMLKSNDAGKILMLAELYKSYGLPTDFLPKYENNGSRELKPPTDLIKRFQLGIRTQDFNKLLNKYGYLEERERPSTVGKDGIKTYKTLTDKGLEFGENMINAYNQKEVQPYYYTNSFQELYKTVIQK